MVSEGLNKALASLFESVSQNVADNPAYGNTKELLIFANRLYAECQLENIGAFQKLFILDYMVDLYDRVQSWIEGKASTDKNSSTSKDNVYKSLGGRIKRMVDLYREDFDIFMPRDIMSVIFKGWELFYNLESTYSLMAEIVSLMGDPAYPDEKKWEFIQIVNKVTLDWGEI